jgi:hypothetical protein
VGQLGKYRLSAEMLCTIDGAIPLSSSFLLYAQIDNHLSHLRGALETLDTVRFIGAVGNAAHPTFLMLGRRVR